MVMSTMRKVLAMKCLGLLLVASLLLQNSAGEPTTVVDLKWSDNIEGKVLVLDSWSLDIRANRPLLPGEDYAQTCADACRRLPGCNAYTICLGDKGRGCGQGCQRYVQVNPPAQSDGFLNRSLPITTFGPYPRFRETAGCQGARGSGTADRWPYGMCTLKQVDNPTAPTMKQEIGEGWISGTFHVPEGDHPAVRCPLELISLAACEKCLNTGDLKGCLSCARRAGQQPLPLLLALEPSLQEACSVCYSQVPVTASPSPRSQPSSSTNGPSTVHSIKPSTAMHLRASDWLPLLDAGNMSVPWFWMGRDASSSYGGRRSLLQTDPAMCESCLLNKEPCGQCILRQQLQQGTSRQLADPFWCMNCVREHGRALVDMCLSCAGARTQAGRARCGTCVGRVKHNACGVPGAPTRGCINVTVSSSLCSTCAASQSYESCVRCGARQGSVQGPFTRDCAGCAELDNVQDQRRCYQCAVASASGDSDCAGCISHSRFVQECLECNQAPGIVHKAGCFACSQWNRDNTTARLSCYHCLSGQHQDFRRACMPAP